MKSLLTLCIVSNCIIFFDSKKILVKRPGIDQKFLKAKNSNGSKNAVNNDPFDNLKIEERAELCDYVLNNQLYCHHKNMKDWEPREAWLLKFKINYQKSTAEGVNITKENVREKSGIKLNGIISHVRFKRFICSIYKKENEKKEIYRELYISSGPHKDAAFILVRNGRKQYLTVCGVLDTFDFVQISEDNIIELIDVLGKNPKPVCKLKENLKFEICSKMHHLYYTEYLAQESNLTDGLLVWYDRGDEACKDRKILINEEDGPNSEHRYEQTLACPFAQFGLEYAQMFVSVKKIRKKSYIATVMVPYKQKYDEETNPLTVDMSFKVSLK